MEAKRLSYKEADLFQYYLEELPQVTKAVVYSGSVVKTKI